MLSSGLFTAHIQASHSPPIFRYQNGTSLPANADSVLLVLRTLHSPAVYLPIASHHGIPEVVMGPFFSSRSGLSLSPNIQVFGSVSR